jgi:glycine oxidase
MSRHGKITVAGGGVLGWTIALALADAGCAEVLVCDPGGDNASSIAGGMLAPVFEAALDETSRPHLDLLTAARDLWPGLAARTGIALDRAGALGVGADAWLAGLAGACTSMGVRLTEIGAATAQGLAPGLSDGCARALLTREDWRVDAPAALSALARAALAAGVRHQSRRVNAKGDEDVLVVATGAASGLGAVAPELRHLSPIKGHIVRVEAEAMGAVVRSEGVYAAPGPGMAFGATMEPGVSDPRVDEQVAAPLLEAGLRLFPGLRGAPVQVAAGIRASTPDGLPLVGWSEAEPGVILAAGARRNGWLLAPLVAKIVTACVTGAARPRYAERMDPARFRDSLWG